MNSKNSSSISKERESIFPCKLCPKNVTDNDNAILCDLCQTWVYNEHKSTNEFLDSLVPNYYLPYIIQPTRHTSH